jgi:HK97 gp10 family phage protein
MFQRSTVEGAKELDEALAELDKQVATRLGMTAVRASGLEGKRMMIEAAPYRPGERLHRGRDYGHLRDNIRVRKSRSQKPNYVVYEITTGRAFWGNFLEFGTVKMSPRPWARPTVDRMPGPLVTIQIDVLRRGIERIAAKAAKGKLQPNGLRI